MKAVVSIGTEKTGSSSIQFFLMVNREKLIKQGFYFMESTGKLDDRKLSAYCYKDNKFDDFHNIHLIKTVSQKKTFELELQKNISVELSSIPNNIHTVVFSSEHFHSRVRSSSERNKLKELLSKFFDDIELVCYLRPQFEMAVSQYSTALKNHAVHSVEQHIKNCKPDNYYYNYQKMLSNWAETFSKDKIKVRLFNRAELKSGDVVEDFCDLVGINYDVLEPVEFRNESVQPTGQEILKIINNYIPNFIEGIGKNPARVEIVNWISSYYAGQGSFPKTDILKSIQDEFRFINKNVAEDWFPHKDVLFDLDFSKYEQTIPVDSQKVSCFENLIKDSELRLKTVIDAKVFLSSKKFQDCFPIKNTSLADQFESNENLTNSIFKWIDSFLNKYKKNT